MTLLPASLAAQQPLLSPRDTARARVGPATILIDYGRPSKRGREIFGALVPWDRVWRTGANEATTLISDRTLAFDAAEIPPGRFTLFTVPSPSPGRWVLIVSRPAGRYGLDFNPDSIVARVSLSPAALPETVEQFLIRIEALEGGAGLLRLAWDRTEAIARFTIRP
ncbi:MAG: DUF2911 domain-containing protein [Gemmatimonadales bacterium]